MLTAPSFPSAILNNGDFEISTSSSSLIFRSRASARSFSDTLSAMIGPPDLLVRLMTFRVQSSRFKVNELVQIVQVAGLLCFPRDTWFSSLSGQQPRLRH